MDIGRLATNEPGTYDKKGYVRGEVDKFEEISSESVRNNTYRTYITGSFFYKSKITDPFSRGNRLF